MPNKIPVVEKTCDVCKLAPYCSENGASPFIIPGSSTKLRCRLINGYGAKDVERSILSASLAEKFDQGYTKLTIVEIPMMEPDIGSVVYKAKTILHPSVDDKRESNYMVNILTTGIKAQR